MAKSKEKVNKSEEVRKILSASPDKPVKEVVEEMGKKGMKITPNLVYFIKGKMSGKKKRKKRIAKAAMAASKASSNGAPSRADAITLIKEVKALAEKSGGYDKLTELVQALNS